MLASREYGAIDFFVVYIAVINGAESAGGFLSFGPSKSILEAELRLSVAGFIYHAKTPFKMQLRASNIPAIDFAQAAQAANRILSFRVPNKTVDKATSELQDTEGGVKIELRDLWFKYPTRDVPIFTGLNLTVSVSSIKSLQMLTTTD